MTSVSSGREPSNSGEPPESTSTPETPKTRPQACERCWKRKQKCDRRLPSCTTCQGLGVECIPRNQDFNKLSELSHTYVESLKKRVADLEEQASSRKRARTSSHISESVVGPSLVNAAHAESQRNDHVPSSSTVARSAQRGNEDSSVRATMGAIGFLSRSAMAEPRDHSDDLPRKFSLGEIISGALAIDGRDPSTASPAPRAPAIDSHFTSLSHDAMSGYFQRFLDQTAFLTYINEENLLEQYMAVVADNELRNESKSPLQVFNTHMGLAIGILMSPDSSHLSLLSANFHAIAVKQLPSVLRSEAPTEHIHCMVMLLVYSLFNPSGGSAWHLLGLTVKTCISIGLHREPDAHTDLTLAEHNKRRWLFWSVYLLDRTVMDRPLSIQDDDISVRVPPEEGDTPLSTSDSSKRSSLCRYLLLYAQLISSIRTKGKGNILLDYSNFSHWRDLPPSMERLQSTAQSTKDVLHQLSARALAQLVSPTALQEVDAGLLLGSVNDVEMDALMTSDQFIGRCYDRFTAGDFVGSFIDAYDVFQAGVVCVCLTWRKGQESPTERRLTKVTEIINKASTLVTVIASRFPALSAFQRVLLALSTRIVDNSNNPYTVRQIIILVCHLTAY
ncbi:uncharacterized protein CTRU02_214298 [Colletotrichum truncatum]|uniref:Uncharacterized protein n=1 Tax=Colletotrichum truncatum TaxID=5467 RepID=A0ACC3YI30_COLTU